ncbi:MAG: 3'-5' exonuclease [Amylibacter sp.]
MVEIKCMQLTGRTEHWFVKPKHLISDLVTRINGVTNDDVANAPSIGEIKDEVLSCLAGCSIIGHNVGVEVNILKRSFTGYIPTAAFDTLNLSKNLMPSLQSYSLKNVGEELGLTSKATMLSQGKHHSALFDATLTALVFLRLLKPFNEIEMRAALNRSDIMYEPQMKLF